ncbi:hypothetical protein [Massilia sp. TSP1-1-2]|uniref:hypothetical protein n=1 Tax=Massilia sp. TSP1-1-2 TaxID=2804649 RepID=UPI003CF0F38D
MHACNCHKTLDELPSQTRELLDQADLRRPLLIVREIGRFIHRGHEALKRDELSAALGIDGGSADRLSVQREMDQARRCVTALSVEMAKKSNEREAAAQWHARNRDATDGALRGVRDMFVNSLRESGLPAQDALEGLGIWDATVSTLRDRGFAALLGTIDTRCQELEAALQEGEDWGRKPHSPIETWQWIVIAIILVIAVALVIVCLIWFGCSWFYYIFVGACFATGAFGGWAGLCAGFVF